MRIIYIHQYFTTPDLGGATRSYEFARYLSEKGNEVTIICGSSKLEKNKYFKFNRFLNLIHIENINLLVVKDKYSHFLSYTRRVISFLTFVLSACIGIVRLKKPDIIFASSTPLTVSIIGFVGKIFFKVPFVFEVRDLWPEYIEDYGITKNRAIIRLLEEFSCITYKGCQKIIVTSPTMIERIANKYNIDQEKISCIPIGTDLYLAKNVNSELCAQYKIKYDLSNKFIIGYAGTVGFIHNVSYILELAEILKNHKDIIFLIVGEGNEKQQLREKVKFKKLQNVYFLDKVPKKNLFSILSLFDLTVVTTRPYNKKGEQHINAYDNFSNKFFDYLASSKPVLINSYGVIAEYLKKYQCGKLLDPLDINSAVQTILNLKSNPALLRLMGKNARSLSEKEFDRVKLAEKLNDVLVQTLQN